MNQTWIDNSHISAIDIGMLVVLVFAVLLGLLLGRVRRPDPPKE